MILHTKNIMKTKAVVAGLVAVAAALTTYFLIKRRSNKAMIEPAQPKQHHLTQVFAKAKTYAK